MLETLSEHHGGGGPRNQVIYATHSPHFVDLKRFDQVRIARKNSSDDGLPPSCEFSQYSLLQASEKLAEVVGVPADRFTRDSFRAHSLPIFATMMSEGFFADIVFIVEGLGEFGFFESYAESTGRSWRNKNIAILPASGKRNIDRPVVTFRGLGIPTYFLFDADGSHATKNSDREPTAKINRQHLKLAGAEEVDFPATTVDPTWACFEECLEDEVRKEVGDDLFSQCTQAVAGELGFKPSQTLKNMECAGRLAQMFIDQGQRVGKIDEILDAVEAHRL